LWAALLLPTRRRKLFMRPLASSRSCMLGMLLVMLMSRRRAQKLPVIVTARTGMSRSLAWGDLARFSMPWSFQPGASVSVTLLGGIAVRSVAAAKIRRLGRDDKAAT